MTNTRPLLQESIVGVRMGEDKHFAPSPIPQSCSYLLSPLSSPYAGEKEEGLEVGHVEEYTREEKKTKSLKSAIPPGGGGGTSAGVGLRGAGRRNGR